MPEKSPAMIALQGLTPAMLAEAVSPVTLEEARKIVSAAHREGKIERPLVGVRRVSMDAVRARGFVPALEVRAVHRSAVDPFVKYALGLADGNVIETVRIPLEKQGRFSVCVSSQVGCALACAFCATGRMGLRRNLETWEIVEQVRVVRAELDRTRGEKVHGVVFQGMGEPMANLDRVLDAIAVMTEPSAQAIDARGITVCTSGLPTGIRRLAREAPKVRLGLSIGTARREARKSLMPIDAAHSLDEVMEASIEHARTTGLSPMWAVTPLNGVNDAREDAVALAALAKDFSERSGSRPRISVIPYNAIDVGDRDPFTRSPDESEARFRDAMRELGYPTHKRYSGGGDVNAACGQLANKA